MKVHVLSGGAASPAGLSLIYPLIRFRHELAAAGFEIRIFFESGPGLAAADLLLLDSKVYGARWGLDADGVLAEIEGLRQRAGRLVYVDNGDSSGLLRVAVLPLVHRYWKGQLLADRLPYTRPLYGGRLFTDFVFGHLGIKDEPPQWSQPVPDPAWLDKLRVHWNMGLADLGRCGPRLAVLFDRLPWTGFLRPPKGFTRPDALRGRALSARFGAGHDRATVAWQRQELRRRLARRADLGPLKRRAYLAELAQAAVTLSPFGWGEICLRDLEAALCGSCLAKPSMAMIETWPNWYQSDQTYAPIRWDLGDLEAVLDRLQADALLRQDLAAGLQVLYRRHLAEPQAAMLFIERFAMLARDAALEESAAAS